MVASGETSGELETMLQRSATNQERELEMTLGTLMGILEPMMVVFMGGMVLGIVLALLILFVWTGAEIESLGRDKSPEMLTKQIANVDVKIEESTWEVVKDDFEPNTDHLPRAKMGRRLTAEAPYALLTPTTPASRAPVMLREDPDLYVDVQAAMLVDRGLTKTRSR